MLFRSGGGTGTGSAPYIAQLARKMGLLSVAIVTMPFSMEGSHRFENAIIGLEKLEQSINTMIVIPNEKLLELAPNLPLQTAFKVADEILTNSVKGIAELVTKAGLVNLDFADVKAIMKGAGSTLMGVGTATGENRATVAARTSVASPLLDASIDGARGVLFNITGGSDMTMNEVDEAAKVITSHADPDAQIIFGAAIDEKLIDQVKVTVVATGFDDSRRQYVQMTQEDAQLKELESGEKSIGDGQIGEDEFDIPTFLRQIR